MPPEAGDVPDLMKNLVSWEHRAEKEGVPFLIIAGLVHYQFVTIHPYYDGNGRTARLLSTFILQRSGYGLDVMFSLEEYHALDLDNYYHSLMTHPHHNYYEGRHEADLTGWVSYFVSLLAKVFVVSEREIMKQVETHIDQPAIIRKLDHRQKVVLGLFADSEFLAVREIARNLGLSERMVRNLVNQWIDCGFMVTIDPSNKNRKYSLSEIYRKHIRT